MYDLDPSAIQLTIYLPWYTDTYLYSLIFLSGEFSTFSANHDLPIYHISFHQISIIAEQTEAAGNINFPWHFYTQLAEGIEPHTTDMRDIYIWVILVVSGQKITRRSHCGCTLHTLSLRAHDTGELMVLHYLTVPELFSLRAHDTGELMVLHYLTVPELLSLRAHDTGELMVLRYLTAPELLSFRAHDTGELMVLRYLTVPELLSLRAHDTGELMVLHYLTAPELFSLRAHDTGELMVLHYLTAP